MELTTFLLSIATILVLSYYFIKKKYNYWKDRGVVSVKPQFPLGNLGGAGFSTNFGEKARDLYNQLKGNGVFAGYYSFLSPVVLVTDLDLLRNVFVKDFDYFSTRGTYANEKSDPLSCNLANLDADKWRKMRKRLTPTFTSGKMKMMHNAFLQVSAQFTERLGSLTEKSAEVEIKTLFEQFNIDVIGHVAFGMELNSLNDQNSDFQKFGRRVFQLTPLQFFKKRLFIMTFPKLAKRLDLCWNKQDLTDFYLTIIRQTIDHREKNNIQRNDFLQLLMQIKDTGKLEGETVDLGKLSFEELAAQVFIFLAAGFETSSSTLTFAAYELALNPEIQDKARAEIKEVLQNHNGVMSYEAAMDMTYVDQIVRETLRKYPIGPTLHRKVTMEYKVPDTDLVLEKDTSLVIPVLGIHHDPEIYPEPEIFDPERFTKENISKRHPYAWLPFGEGQRNCIGMRFGMMQVRMGLATLLNSFRVLPSEKTPKEIKFLPSSITLSPVGGMFLGLEKV